MKANPPAAKPGALPRSRACRTLSQEGPRVESFSLQRGVNCKPDFRGASHRGSSDDAVPGIAHHDVASGRAALDLLVSQTGKPPFNPRDAPISIHFADATFASCFIARWCVGSKIKTVGARCGMMSRRRGLLLSCIGYREGRNFRSRAGVSG
jgi:hypothetical protein